VQAAVLPRACFDDILVQRQPVSLDALEKIPASIATSSTRRRAQWLNRFPHHRIENLRGNVNARLQKVADSSWDGAIFAAAGLERIGLRPADAITLDWMLPAPAQGAIMVVCREGNEEVLAACAPLHDPATALCTQIEKDFLRTLRGGCTAPIGALAVIRDGGVSFTGTLLSPDGRQKLDVARAVPDGGDAASLGTDCGQYILENGGTPIIEQLNTVA
jgi:hydroxymethylbilane synthase